jgi:hypothetical protein
MDRKLISRGGRPSAKTDQKNIYISFAVFDEQLLLWIRGLVEMHYWLKPQKYIGCQFQFDCTVILDLSDFDERHWLIFGHLETFTQWGQNLNEVAFF